MASPVDFPDSDAEHYKVRRIIYPDSNVKFKSKELETAIAKLNGFDKKADCLYTSFRSLLTICQLSTIFPVKYDSKNCRLVHSWDFILPWANLFWLTMLGAIMSYFLPGFFHIFAEQLYGTSFYTFVIAISVQMLVLFTIYACGNYNAARLEKAWDKLHKVSEELILSKYKRIKYWVYIPSLYIKFEIGTTFCLSLYYVQLNSSGANSLQFALPISGYAASFIPELIAATFSVLFWVISLNFDAINVSLENILQDMIKGRSSDVNMSLQLATLKRQHEDLCVTVRLLLDGFGIQMLAVFIGASVTFVSGVYGVILVIQGLVVESVRSAFLFYGIENMIFCGLRLLLVVVISQKAINSANRSANILNKFDEYGHSEDMKSQVNEFLRKVGNFPLRITCCNIFDMGNTFIASGASNVVTYTLILMQFKQADGN